MKLLNSIPTKVSLVQNMNTVEDDFFDPLLFASQAFGDAPSAVILAFRIVNMLENYASNADK